MRVITVSDSAVVTNSIKNIFQQRGLLDLEFTPISTVQELKETVNENSIVLVDWEADIPECLPFVVASREIRPDVPILILSTRAKAGSALAGINAGASGVVTKPLVPEELLTAVARVLRKGQSSRPTVNVDFINPFIDATSRVFSSMCRVEIARRKIFVKPDYTMMGDISGVMRLHGEACGSVVLSMSTEFACMVVGNMLGQQLPPELSTNVADAVGELINVIAGQTKAGLATTAYTFSIDLPTVITEKGLEIDHAPGTPNIVVIFEGAGHEFALQVCLAPSGGTQP